MIQLRKLAFSRTGRPLVESASLQIHPGWRVGLTGANGCGKSSLLALLLGQLHADAGDLELPGHWVMAHVRQDTEAHAVSAIDYVLDGDQEFRRIEAELKQAENDHDGEAIGTLHARLSEIDGYGARARAAALLHGLGFSDPEFDKSVAEFSGGWRMRLNLASALMCRSHLLLLDEPTNHLDLDAVFWLENWLRSYQGTLIVISHDRDFLDAVTSHILHIENQTLTLYRGGYSDFENTRAERLAREASLYERQQREVAHLHRFVERFRAKATKARQAQSRLKALERMERIAPAHVDSPFTFRFPEPGTSPDPLLRLERADTGYGDQITLRGVTLTLRPGDRVALLGRNGAGKSTLVKLLAGDLALRQGERTEGKGIVFGYFAQHQMEALRPDESPLQHLQRLEPSSREQDLRDFLGGFDFRGDMASAPCGRFSGGEKSRLALALLVRQRPNLLLLDEPTNHLDLEMREALTLALQEYEGSVILVSHDRHLLRTTADTLLLVSDGKVQPFDGDLDDYAQWLAEQRNQEAKPAPEVVSEKQERLQTRQQEAAQRQAALQARRALLKELDKIEKQLNGWQGEKKILDERLSDPGLYAVVNTGKESQLASLLRRQGELQGLIDASELRWLELQEQLEALTEC